MKKALYIICLTLLFSCDTENGYDCFQTSGSIIQQEFVVTNFTKILVNRDVELIITDGPEFKVVIETGENLLSDILIEVSGNQLQISDNNTCNYVRDYGITKAIVTAPNLRELRNSSQYEITSIGVLNYNNLTLISEDFSVPGNFTVGDFKLDLNTLNLEVVSNGLSSFNLEGQSENLSIGFFAGSGRFEGENLVVQHVEIFHRGSNEMIINPQQSLIGELRGSGNLISVNQPAIVDVEQYYTGELIFEN
jgi:hypothetical protein